MVIMIGAAEDLDRRCVARRFSTTDAAKYCGRMHVVGYHLVVGLIPAWVTICEPPSHQQINRCFVSRFQVKSVVVCESRES